MLADGSGDGRLSFHGDRRFHGSPHYFLTNVIPKSHDVKLQRSNGNPPSEPQSTRVQTRCPPIAVLVVRPGAPGVSDLHTRPSPPVQAMIPDVRHGWPLWGSKVLRSSPRARQPFRSVSSSGFFAGTWPTLCHTRFKSTFAIASSAARANFLSVSTAGTVRPFSTGRCNSATSPSASPPLPWERLE